MYDLPAKSELNVYQMKEEIVKEAIKKGELAGKIGNSHEVLITDNSDHIEKFISNNIQNKLYEKWFRFTKLE